MRELIENLQIGQVLYTTKNDVKYKLLEISIDGSLKYSINTSIKTLPISTINAALKARNNKIIVNAKWYKSFNPDEYKSRPCNLSVLKNLLKKNS